MFPCFTRQLPHTSLSVHHWPILAPGILAETLFVGLLGANKSTNSVKGLMKIPDGRSLIAGEGEVL